MDKPQNPAVKALEDYYKANHEADAPGREITLEWVSDIEAAPVEWLWEDQGEGRIPTGCLAMAAGREGTGKTSFCLWLTAQLTRGTLPGTYQGEPRTVLYVAVEDSWPHTVRPRLDAAGADLTRVARLKMTSILGYETTPMIPGDLDLIESAIEKTRAAVLVCDPIMSMINSKLDTHKTRDVRTALEPLVGVAQKTGCTIIGIGHFSKSHQGDPISLLSGSGAFKDVPRSVLAFAADQTGLEPSIMTQVKNSVGKTGLPSKEYTIQPAIVQTGDGPTEVGRLEWGADTDRSVADVISDPGESLTRTREVAEWLRDVLSGGIVSQRQIKTEALAEGYAWRTVEAAKKIAGVKSVRQEGKWWWCLTPKTEEK